MNPLIWSSSRRRFIQAVGLAAAAWLTPGVFAQELTRTPSQTEGPFYPDRLPLDTDNDLIIVNDAITPAVGQVTHLNGRILDSRGTAVRNALVEIWQVDNNASYLHSRSSNRTRYDRNFQGFGRFMTGANGEYYFRTIKPVPYPGRTAHIHFAVKIRGQEKFTTQLYVRGEPGNERDGILNSIRDARAKASIIVDFAAIPNSRINELAARFDILLGYTPEA